MRSKNLLPKIGVTVGRCVMNKEPKDRFVTIRMPIELFKVVKALADGQTRSVSRQIIHLVKTGLEAK